MKKFISITVLASVTTFGLFAFMAFLISSEQVIIPEPENFVQIDVFQTPEDSAVVEKPKPQFEPPKPPPSMSREEVTPETSTINSAINYQPIGLKIDDSGSAISPMKGLPNSDARPVVRVNPKYPTEAASKGIEGWVVLAFDISAIGEVINVKVVDSAPRRIFDKAAKKALRKWKYRAKSIDGKQVAQRNFTVQLDFTMSQNI